MIENPSDARSTQGNASLFFSWTYIPLVIAFCLRLAEPTANLSYLLIAAYALFGYGNAIRALAMTWLFTMLNPGIAPDPSFASVGRYVVLLATAFGVFIRGGIIGPTRYRRSRQTFWTVLLGLFLTIHSLAFSMMADVSALKVMSWMLTMTCLFSAWSGLEQTDRRNLEVDIFVFLVIILFMSVPLAFFPVGYLTNGTGFQGLLNQPQAYGVFLALLGTVTTALILVRPNPHWGLFGVAALCVLQIVLSETRTAGLALLLGIGAAVVMLPLLTRSSLLKIAPGLLSKRLSTVVAAAVLMGLSFSPVLFTAVDSFITKSNRADVSNIIEAYSRSRGVLIDPMLENIAEHPLTGIGFGIASRPAEMTVLRDPLLGLPVGAAVEKGVLPLMILEEVGVFGFLFVFLWLLMIFRRSASSGLPAFAVVATTLFLNLGEASLFSPGGMGMLGMVLLGWAATGSRADLTHSARKFMQPRVEAKHTS